MSVRIRYSIWDTVVSEEVLRVRFYLRYIHFLVFKLLLFTVNTNKYITVSSIVKINVI